ncbi:MAG: hypothetical protein M1820_005312 [Bogoriella megaspora]|nr:MAG: hypothetical protein M1820_005312 [Bogoriella megaspora]
MAGFGVSLSDLTTIGAFAWKLYKSCKNAGPLFQEASQDVVALHTVLRELEDETTNPRSLINRNDKATELGRVSSGSHATLKELDTILSRYRSLGTSRKGLRDRLQFGSESLQHIRQSLVLNTGVLNFFLTSLNTGALGRIEQKLEESIEAKLDQIILDMRSGHVDEDVLSVAADDTPDDEVSNTWKALEDKLQDNDINRTTLEEHKEWIKVQLRDKLNQQLLNGSQTIKTQAVGNLNHEDPSGRSLKLNHNGKSYSHLEPGPTRTLEMDERKLALENSPVFHYVSHRENTRSGSTSSSNNYVPPPTQSPTDASESRSPTQRHEKNDKSPDSQVQQIDARLTDIYQDLGWVVASYIESHASAVNGSDDFTLDTPFNRRCKVTLETILKDIDDVRTSEARELSIRKAAIETEACWWLEAVVQHRVPNQTHLSYSHLTLLHHIQSDMHVVWDMTVEVFASLEEIYTGASRNIRVELTVTGGGSRFAEQEAVQFRVPIPPGAADGHREEVIGRASNGTLHAVNFEIRELLHTDFGRQGNDLFTFVAISPASKTHDVFMLPDGRSVVYAAKQPGLRTRHLHPGLGMPTLSEPDQHGDLVVITLYLLHEEMTSLEGCLQTLKIERANADETSREYLFDISSYPLLKPPPQSRVLELLEDALNSRMTKRTIANSQACQPMVSQRFALPKGASSSWEHDLGRIADFYAASCSLSMSERSSLMNCLRRIWLKRAPVAPSKDSSAQVDSSHEVVQIRDQDAWSRQYYEFSIEEQWSTRRNN